MGGFQAWACVCHCERSEAIQPCVKALLRHFARRNDGKTNRDRDRRRQARRRASRRRRCSATAGRSSPTSTMPRTRCPAARPRSSPTSPIPIARRSSSPPPATAAGRSAGQQCGALRVGRVRRIQRRRIRRAHGGQCPGARAPDRALRARARNRMRCAGRQPARFQAGRAQSRLSELHLVEAGAGRPHRACGAGARAARHPGQRDCPGTDAALERSERGEFRRDACQQPAWTRGRAGTTWSRRSAT